MWQQNRHQKVIYRLKARGVYICAVGLDILKFEQTSLFYSAFLNSRGLELCFGGPKSPSKTSHGYGCVVKLQFAFKCNWIGKVLGYPICQACKICQTFCLWAWQGPNAFRLCLFCFKRQCLCWDYFAFIWTQLVEVVMCKSVVLKKETWECHSHTKIKRKATPNSLNRVSIYLQELLHWIFLFHWRLLTSSANLRVASTSVRSQPCFNNRQWLLHSRWREMFANTHFVIFIGEELTVFGLVRGNVKKTLRTTGLDNLAFSVH